MNDSEMPLIAHLSELRKTIIRMAVGFGLAFIATWTFHRQVFEFLSFPVMKGLKAHNVLSLQALHVTEGIVVYMKSAAVAAVILASPWIVWQAWRFVAPALRIVERRTFIVSGFLAILFFALGTLFSYTVFIPVVVDFLAGFGLDSGSLVLVPTLQNTFDMALLFLVGFGVIFELPLIMLFIGVMKVASPRRLLSSSRWFIVGAFVIAAIFTPPEPISQTLMAIPICMLYMLGILLAWAGWHIGGENRLRALAVAGSAVLIFAVTMVGVSLYFSRQDPSPGLYPGRFPEVSESATVIKTTRPDLDTGQKTDLDKK